MQNHPTLDVFGRPLPVSHTAALSALELAGIVAELRDLRAAGTPLHEVLVEVLDRAALERRLRGTERAQALALVPRDARVIGSSVHHKPELLEEVSLPLQPLPRGHVFGLLQIEDDVSIVDLDLLTRALVVYFDTSFFVQLARLDDAAALSIVADLNTLRVRPVVSDMLLRELLSSWTRPDQDKILVERLERVALAPYQTTPSASWKTLLADGPEREGTARILRAADDVEAEAASHSLIAARISTNAHAAKAALAAAQALGLADATGAYDGAAIEQFGLAVVGRLGIQGGRPDDLATVLDSVQATLAQYDPAAAASVELQRRLETSVAATHNGPVDIVAGTATPDARKRFANTRRDAEHMRLFVTHAASIDLLQIDGPQAHALARPSPVHELRRIGLDRRCFAAPTPATALDYVRTFAQRVADELG